MPGTRAGASSMPRQAKEPAAKGGKRPASTKRKADTQPEPMVTQPASRPRAGKEGRGTSAVASIAAKPAQAADTPIRASKRARIEKSATVQIIKPSPKRRPKAAKQVPKPAAAPAAKGKASAAAAVVSKAPTSAASRKQAIRAKARAASQQKPAAAPAKARQARPDPVGGRRKAKAASKKQFPTKTADAERPPAPEDGAPPAEPPADELAAQPSRLSMGKRKGGRAATRTAAEDAPPASAAAQSEPAGPASGRAAAEPVSPAAEPPADPSSEDAVAPEGADGNLSAVDAVIHGAKAELPHGHGGPVEDGGGNGVPVLASGDEHQEATNPSDTGVGTAQHGSRAAPAHRESIIRTRTGQALELELAASRAPHDSLGQMVSAVLCEGYHPELSCVASLRRHRAWLAMALFRH